MIADRMRQYCPLGTRRCELTGGSPGRQALASQSSSCVCVCARVLGRGGGEGWRDVQKTILCILNEHRQRNAAGRGDLHSFSLAREGWGEAGTNA